MKYCVTLKLPGRETATHEVNVTASPAGTLSATVAGSAEPVEVALVPDGALVARRGSVLDISTARDGETVALAAGEVRALATVVPAATARRRSKRQGAGQAETLVAPMPGRVLKVHVAAGDEVKPGDALMVIEAMKMENELRADGAATIAAIEVEAGQTVERNATLIRFSSTH